jgi:hypothetical protein
MRKRSLGRRPLRSIDASLRQEVTSILGQFPHLRLESGRRHLRIVHTRSQDFVPVAGSSGDRRARSGLHCALRRLAETGRGFIAAKSPSNSTEPT